MAEDGAIGGGSLAIIGMPATTTYGADVTRTHALWLSRAPGAPQGAIMKDLGDLATGREYTRGFKLMGYSSPIQLAGPVDEYSLAIMAALACGRDAVSSLGSGAYQHVVTKVPIDGVLRSTSIEVYHSTPTHANGDALNYDGFWVDELSARWQNDGEWSWDVTALTEGQASQLVATTTPTYTPTTPLWMSGGTQIVLSTTTPTGVTGDPGTTLATVANMGGGTGQGWTNVDLSLYVKSGVIRVRNSGVAMRQGSNSGLVTKIRRGRQRMTLDLTLSYDFTNSTIYNFLISHGAATNWGAIVRKINNTNIGGSYNHGHELIIPRVQLSGRPEITGEVNRERDIRLSFEVCDIGGALDVYYWHFWNGQNIDYVS